MRRIDFLLIVLFAGSLLAAEEPASTGTASRAGAAPDDAVVTQRSGDNVRTASAAPQGGRQTSSTGPPRVPLIGFIDSPSATCFQPDPAQDICYISWYYLSVDATPNYMIAMWLILNPNVVLKSSGFFQTSMYIPYNQLGIGFKVQCGPPVDDTSSCTAPCTFLKVGNSYSYTVRARDSANLSSANYGTVTCPAFIP